MCELLDPFGKLILPDYFHDVCCNIMLCFIFSQWFLRAAVCFGYALRVSPAATWLTVYHRPQVHACTYAPMHACTNVCMPAHTTHTCTHARIHAYTHTCSNHILASTQHTCTMSTSVYPHSTQAHTSLHPCTNTTHTCTHEGIDVHRYGSLHTHTYIHTCTHGRTHEI